MAGQIPISGLPPIIGGRPNASNIIPMVDPDDTREASSGTTVRNTVAQLFTGPRIVAPDMTSPSITGEASWLGLNNFSASVGMGNTYPGFTVSHQTAVVVAPGGNVVVGDFTATGFLSIVATTTTGAAPNADMAIGAVLGNLGGTVIAVAARGTWGAVQGAANNHNLYFDLPNRLYRLENLTAFTVTYGITGNGFFPNA